MKTIEDVRQLQMRLLQVLKSKTQFILFKHIQHNLQYLLTKSLNLKETVFGIGFFQNLSLSDFSSTFFGGLSQPFVLIGANKAKDEKEEKEMRTKKAKDDESDAA